MTQTVLDALYSMDVPSVEALGGEEVIYASQSDLVADPLVGEVALALCAEWGHLRAPDKATTFLLDAAAHVTPFAAKDLFATILNSEDALPAVAPALEDVFRTRARTAGPVRDFALEAWTCLLLGGWAQMKNALFAALEDGARADDATPALVRALGSALTWSKDTDLQRTLTTLLTHDELDGDASMELGIYAVAQAVRCDAVDEVRAHLGAAREHFHVATRDEQRPDAVAFDAVISGVLDQTAGHTVPAEEYERIAHSVYAYLDGYAGVQVPARAQTAVAWMDLLGDLRDADVDHWYTPARTISSLGRALAAQKTFVVVVRADEHRGVRELVRPHVESIVGRNADAITHLRRWLGTDDGDPHLHETVEQFLHEWEDEPPKDVGGPLAMAVRDHAPAEVQDVLDSFERLHIPLSYVEEQLVTRLVADSDTHAEGGVGPFRTELMVLFHALVRFASRSLDRAQTSKRSPKWFASEKPWPEEAVLADAINDALMGGGLDSTVEDENAGGRGDIRIRFARCRFAIEVKRTVRLRDDERLVTDYGAQAVQYASTDVPVAILAVADYHRREVRLDLPAVFRTVPYQLDPTSRQNALTTLRVQANVATPSASSAKGL
ncbi:hypothetical protein [Microbacterium sp.]|uniref:hypothetical protein n=1 Tax=Microbacterium sp. TaxID=51671 RepID=UPI00289D58D6|nr:hypothetical protein [Microbacterium sp.]